MDRIKASGLGFRGLETSICLSWFVFSTALISKHPLKVQFASYLCVGLRGNVLAFIPKPKMLNPYTLKSETPVTLDIL